jgi:hypothetical protein
MSENKGLRTIPGFTREEDTGGWGTLDEEDLHNL